MIKKGKFSEQENKKIEQTKLNIDSLGLKKKINFSTDWSGKKREGKFPTLRMRVNTLLKIMKRNNIAVISHGDD